MHRHETRHAGLRVAGLAVAATTGALVGFGVRRGAPAMVLSAAGDRLRGVPAFVAPDRSVGASAVLGLAHHVALTVAWALVFALLGERLTLAGRAAVAALVATLAVSVDRVLPNWLCIGAGVASTPQRALLAIVLAAALLGGMPFAQRQS